jgi:ABC-type Na+ efflux pump permease subunit
MLAPAVIERELRLSLRKLQPRKERLQVAILGTVVVTVFFVLSFIDKQAGASLHFYLFLGALYLAVVRPVRLILGIFSEERRAQTLELLYLTGMSPGDLFLGKVLGGILVSSCELMAVVPLLAFPFLMGGVSLDVFIATAAALPTLLVLMLAVSLLSSVVSSNDGAELLMTFAIVALLSVCTPIPYMLGKALAGRPPFSSYWLTLSPAYAPWLALNRFATGTAGEFWMGTAITWAISAALLVVAGFYLSQNWRIDPDARKRVVWQQTFNRWLARDGSDAGKSVLETNPFQWIAQRDCRPLLLVWGAIASICALWLLGWWAWPKFWPSTSNFLVTGFLLLTITDLLTAYAAGRRLGEDRRDGTLELLLTTPLAPEQIVEGQEQALRRQFHPARLTVCSLFVVLMAGGFVTRAWSLNAAISYTIIWLLFIGWCVRKGAGSAPLSMWIALNTGRPAMAMLRSVSGGGNWGWIWMIYNLNTIIRAFGRGIVQFPTGSTQELVIVSFVAVILLIIAATRQNAPSEMREKLIREMREIAREPLPDPHSARFWKWNVRERYQKV